MSKKAYVGVVGTARKVNKMYVGIGNTARKVVKGYVGIDGVARQFWPSGGIIGDWDVNRAEIIEEIVVGQTYTLELAPFEDVLGYALHRACNLWPSHVEPYQDTIEDTIHQLVVFLANYFSNNSTFKNYFRDTPLIIEAAFTGTSINDNNLYVAIYIPTSSTANMNEVEITDRSVVGGVEKFISNKTIQYRRIASAIRIDTQYIEYPYIGRTYNYNYFGRTNVDSGFTDITLFVSNVNMAFSKINFPKDDNILLQWSDFSNSLFDELDTYVVDAQNNEISNNGIEIQDGAAFATFPIFCTGKTVMSTIDGTKGLFEIRISYTDIDEDTPNACLICITYKDNSEYIRALVWDGTEWVWKSGYETTSSQTGIYWSSTTKTGIKDKDFFNNCILGFTGMAIYRNRQKILNIGVYTTRFNELSVGFPNALFRDSNHVSACDVGIKNATLYLSNISEPDAQVGDYVSIEDLGLEWMLRFAIRQILDFSRTIIRASSQGESYYDNTLNKTANIEAVVQALMNGIDTTSYKQYRITIEIIKIQYYGGHWDWGAIYFTLWASHQGSSVQGRRKILGKAVYQDNPDYTCCILKNDGVYYSSLSRSTTGYGSGIQVTDRTLNQTWVSDTGIYLTTQENESMGGIYDIKLVMSNIKIKEV